MQNITGDMEIRNKLTVTRGEVGADNGGKRRKVICIKDPWTKPKGGRIDCERWGWLGWVSVIWGQLRQLYLNNNKKRERKKKRSREKLRQYI